MVSDKLPSNVEAIYTYSCDLQKISVDVPFTLTEIVPLWWDMDSVILTSIAPRPRGNFFERYPAV